MNQAIDQLTATGQSSYAALRSLWDIQAGILRKAAAIQYSLVTLGFESGVRQWQLINLLAERDGLVAEQKDIAETIQSRVAAISRDAAGSMQAACEEFAAWMVGDFVPAAVAAPQAAARAKSGTATRRATRKKRG